MQDGRYAASVAVPGRSALVVAARAPATVIAASIIRTPGVFCSATPVAALPPPVGMAVPPAAIGSPVPRFDRADRVATKLPDPLTVHEASVMAAGAGIQPRPPIAAVPNAVGGPAGSGASERGSNREQRDDCAASHGLSSIRSRLRLDASVCKVGASLSWIELRSRSNSSPEADTRDPGWVRCAFPSPRLSLRRDRDGRRIRGGAPRRLTTQVFRCSSGRAVLALVCPIVLLTTLVYCQRDACRVDRARFRSRRRIRGGG